MTQHPFEPLLDRASYHQQAPLFEQSVKILEEMSNYGSHLCSEAWNSSKKSSSDAQVVFHLFRQIVLDVEAIHQLLSNGLSAAAYPSLRSLLEKEHLYEWVLLGDTDAKIRHLYVSAQREERRAARAMIPGTDENKLLLSRFHSVPTENALIDAASAKVARIDKQLQHVEFSAINQAFEKGHNGKTRKYDPNWKQAYAKSSGATKSFNGSVEAIASEIGQLDEYHYIYSHLCSHLHGSALWGSMSMSRSKVHAKPIRGFGGYEFIFRWTTILACRAYGKTFEFYIPKKLNEFTAAFSSWSERFDQVPTIDDET